MTAKDDFIAAIESFVPDMPTLLQKKEPMEVAFAGVVRAGELEGLVDMMDGECDNVRWAIAAFGSRLRHPKCLDCLQDFVAKDQFRFISLQVLQRVSEGAWDGYYRGDQPLSLYPKGAYEPGSYSYSPRIANVLEVASCLPHKVPLGDVPNYSEHLDIRMGAVNVFFVNLVSQTDSHVCFHPSLSTPGHDELLAWLWVIKPDYEELVLAEFEDQEFAEYVRTEIPSRSLFD